MQNNHSNTNTELALRARTQVPVADQKELSSFFQSLINTKAGGGSKKKKVAKKKTATRRSKRVSARTRRTRQDE